jgi:two-component system response regulator LytT
MRGLIVEDEIMVARHLKRLLGECSEQQFENLDHVSDLDEAREALSRQSYDVVFLDLNLSGDDGFLLLEEFASRSFFTIIVSANTDRAARAFEYEVLDFIPKPFSKERIEHALRRLEVQKKPDGAGKGQSKYLSVRHIGKLKIIPVEDVIYVTSDGRYSKIVTRSGKEYLHEKMLRHLLAVLPPNFQRIHKSTIINLGFAQNVVSKPGTQYEITLTNDTSLTVGRTYINALRARFS